MTQVKLAELYDHASKSYQQIDYFNLMAGPKKITLEQLQTYAPWHQPSLAVIDLGVGTGSFLRALHQYHPNMQCTGLDISAKMLKLASEQLPLTTIQDTIGAASQHAPQEQFDIVAANFVCAYAPLETVLKQSQYLLKPGGLLSLITTTHQSFGALQQQIAQMGKSANPLKRLMHYFCDRAIRQTGVPQDGAQAIQIAQAHNFGVLQHQTITTDIKVNSTQEFMHAAFEGGWALSALDYRWVPINVAYAITKLLIHTFQFPIEDQGVVEILLLQK